MKVWVQFLLCVLFSASIWLVLNLSQNYVAIVSVPMTARSNIEGRAALSQSEATVTAQVAASGYRHVVLARRHKRTGQVDFAAADFRYLGGDRYAIPNTSLYRYAAQIFGEGVTVESFISEDPVFSFPEETYKKVPVRAVLDVDFAPQYVKTALDVSEQEKNALLSVASSMQAAMDSYNDAWSARQTSYDISAQKASDAILGYDRLYDPDTGETYRAELGFYDSYDLNRSGFANPNLQRVDDGAEQYYLSGVDYYITK